MCAASAVIPVSAASQEVYGPAVETEVDQEVPLTIVEERPCETEATEEGVILVCRQLDETERYRSPIPREVQSDRTVIPGLTDPPCWVTNPGAVGTSACIRVGYAPEPAYMLDFSTLPEPLASDQVELVTEVENAAPSAEQLSGERVPIDLSEDD
ncbi:hypothetical protein I5L03_02825 [Erythrobacter sp. JGD-13]|uniref:DUF3617 family protein n=2 Tax=Aurantiacibacter sediminis TaxID=2793064 RepID=A0ABS0N0M3_9SPHN|nr:hypothetical protein [Aurantiacibacter sediminis]